MPEGIKCRIYERGNGWPDEGDVVSDDGNAYRVLRTHGTIHTDMAPRGNYIYAVVTYEDWADVPEGTEHPCGVEIVRGNEA